MANPGTGGFFGVQAFKNKGRRRIIFFYFSGDFPISAPKKAADTQARTGRGFREGFLGKNCVRLRVGAGASNAGVFRFFVRWFRWKKVFSEQYSVFSIQYSVFSGQCFLFKRDLREQKSGNREPVAAAQNKPNSSFFPQKKLSPTRLSPGGTAPL
ncbi:MAG: hypothetical protein D6714_04415 [Bacteroidetes bacterium]|nr:MAG: hypothetical protein D6714_04415 [Bacteroidota bacterium]